MGARPGGEPGLSADELDSFWKEGALADFKRPRTYQFVTALPRNAMGKLVRQSVAEGLARDHCE
jgi:acyl-coenzyme A synthetase/AMP-(fatty) acid ligase